MSKQFKELRSMVESSMGKKLPGRRELRESGVKIVAGGEGIEVYENGFIFYKEGCRETVYVVDRIEHITYYFVDDYKTISKEVIDEMPWDVPIIVVCGMRIDANKFSGRFSKEISLEDAGEPVVPSYEEKRIEEMDHTDKLAAMYARIVTLLKNESIFVVSVILRMGVNGSRVDNASSGGITCGINPNGSLKKYFFCRW